MLFILCAVNGSGVYSGVAHTVIWALTYTSIQHESLIKNNYE